MQINFESMFNGCSSLNDIKSLEKWNVSNGNNFIGMFSKCPLLDIKTLEEWKISKEQFNSLKSKIKFKIIKK